MPFNPEKGEFLWRISDTKAREKILAQCVDPETDIDTLWVLSKAEEGTHEAILSNPALDIYSITNPKEYLAIFGMCNARIAINRFHGMAQDLKLAETEHLVSMLRKRNSMHPTGNCLGLPDLEIIMSIAARGKHDNRGGLYNLALAKIYEEALEDLIKFRAK